MKLSIPLPVIHTLSTLKASGFEGFIVGGCVRDVLRGKEPKDWDVTTNATPDQMIGIFRGSKYENKFGTVLVPHKYLLPLPAVSEEIVVTPEQKEQLIAIAKKYLEKIRCRAHDASHSERVADMAHQIALEFDDVNPDVVEIAGWFHDTGRSAYDDARHIPESQEIFEREASEILDKKAVEDIKRILYHDHEAAPESIEQQILREADIIDGINVGRVRTAKEIGLQIHSDWIRDKYNDTAYYG